MDFGCNHCLPINRFRPITVATTTLPVLNRELIANRANTSTDQVFLPSEASFQYPERILQFGTGVLLRGLIDYFVDKANKQDIFQGRIVVVKSTSRGGADAFTTQNGLFTHLVKGITDGKLVEQTWVNNSISRVLTASTEWSSIVKVACDPAVDIWVSNTTEVGIQYVAESISTGVPTSFPGKLLACLYARFQALGSNTNVIVVPTELIVGNGDKLKGIVNDLATFNQLPVTFVTWLASNVVFCNSLVDRIVPGAPEPAIAAATEAELGYMDDLLIFSEPYSLWAIQGDANVKQALSFCQVDKGVVIAEDITPYRERKLRLLNGVHTISVCLAYLAGCRTVKEMMDHALLGQFVKRVALEEVVPSVRVDAESATTFAHEVLDRFRNPHIVHPLINITLQQSSKMNLRNGQTILNYGADHNQVPALMALGYAAFIAFSRVKRQSENSYFGEWNGQEYPIQDDKAAAWAELWQTHGNDLDRLVATVISSQPFNEVNLDQVSGFRSAVTKNLKAILGGELDTVLASALA